MNKPEYHEPWKHDTDIDNGVEFIVTVEGKVIASGYRPRYLSELTRSVDCVNALAGLNPEAVGELLVKAKAAIDAAEWPRDATGRIIRPCMDISPIPLLGLADAIYKIECAPNREPLLDAI